MSLLIIVGGSNMSKIHGIVERYVECAKRIDQPVQEVDQRSLVRSFFSMLGYDLTNPAEGLVSPAVNASTSGSCHAAAGGGDLVRYLPTTLRQTRFAFSVCLPDRRARNRRTALAAPPSPSSSPPLRFAPYSRATMTGTAARQAELVD